MYGIYGNMPDEIYTYLWYNQNINQEYYSYKYHKP